MPKIILNPSRLTVRRKSIKWIVIHHTAELYEMPEVKIDNDKYQMNGIFKGVMELKAADVNYHYVVEKIKGDYIAIATRPLVYLCDWDDIDEEINSRAIHIAAMGNLDFQIPPNRLYEILAYRLVNPLLRLYKLTPDKVKLHKEVSNDSNVYCPGEFFDKGRLIAQTRRFVVK